MAISAEERFDLDQLRDAHRYQQWVISTLQIPSRGAVLEVGAGIGNFTRWLAKTSRRVVAIEPDSACCAHIGLLGLPNVVVAPVRLEDFAEGSQRFDSAVLINVLEHVDRERQILKRIRDLLRRGGSVHIIVPAHRWLFGSLDKRYEHRRRYTTRRMAELLDEAGFAVDWCRYFNPVGAIGWWSAARLARRNSLSRRLIVASELLVPVGRVIDRVRIVPFGQSVAAVARRPDDLGAMASSISSSQYVRSGEMGRETQL